MIMIQKYFFITFCLFFVACSQISNDTVPCINPNCLECSQPHVCTVCQIGKTCCQESCQSCISQTQCTDCLSQYTLNNTINVCQLDDSCFQPGCNKCENNICSSCEMGFVFDKYSYECKLCPTSCAICSVNLTCLTCLPNFYLENGNCLLSIVPNCLECISAYICRKCEIGYTLQNDGSYCLQCPYNCQYCVIISSCLVCNSGSYLTNNGKCKSCAANCQTCYGSATNCTVCHSDSYMFQNQCIHCYTAIPFCVSCIINSTNSLQCISCPSNMYLTPNNTCQLCPSNCKICTNSTNCLTCSMFYYLNSLNSVCSPCQQNCENCTNDTSCGACKITYFLNSQNVCQLCPQNCGSCKSTTFCTSCVNNFYRWNGRCLPCSNNCNTCIGLQVCVACNEGYYKSPMHTCLPCPQYCGYCVEFIYCDYCSAGTYAYENQGYCLPCPVTNCFNCNITASVTNNSNYCSQFFNGFYLNLQMSQCIPCEANCLICSNDTSCDLCGEGYYLNNGACVQCENNCLVCKFQPQVNSLFCLQCPIGYYLTDNSSVCVICPQGCRQCYSSTVCKSCVTNYYLNIPSSSQQQSLPICLPCSYPCLSCSNSAQSCTSCLPGYHINGTSCDACPTGQAICDPILPFTICLDYYAQIIIKQGNLLDISCIHCPQKCIKCNQNSSIYDLNYTVKCTECQIGWNILNNGNCFLCGSTTQTQYCQQCNQNGNCQVCFQGYILNNVGICQLIQESDSNWKYIGADIGLGCLAMFLLIAILYLKLSKPIKPSIIQYQMDPNTSMMTNP